MNGINIHYVEQGEGEPVVFVHGAVADLRAWEKQRDAVAQRYCFIAYTRRYYGSEPWTDGGKSTSAATDAADLVAFTKALGYGPVHVVAWSGGSAATLRAVLEHPEVFRSLSIFESQMGTAFPETPHSTGRSKRSLRVAQR